MKVKKLTIVLFAVLQMCAADFASAQIPSATPIAPMMPPFGRPNLNDILAHMLLLTDAQKTQIQPYLDAVLPQLNATQQQARQAEDKLLKQLDTSIRPFLTPEQQTKLDAFEAMRVSRRLQSGPVGAIDLWEHLERRAQ